MSSVSAAPVSRRGGVGAAQFPTMHGQGRATDNFAKYLKDWCATSTDTTEYATGGAPASDEENVGHGSDSEELSAHASSHCAESAARLNEALTSCDDQPSLGGAQWGAAVRGVAVLNATTGNASGAAGSYPAICHEDAFASGGWDQAIFTAIQWLAEGASHQSIRHNALASTSLCQAAMDAILSQDVRSTTEAFATELSKAVPVETFSGSLVLLCFHPHASVSLWARQGLMGLVQQAAWTIPTAAAPCGESGEAPPSRTKEMARLLALWQLALNVICVIKHLQAVRFDFEKKSSASVTVTATDAQRAALSKDRVHTVVRGFYQVLIVITSLTAKLTTATTAVQESNATPAARVPTTHPTTPLLLGGSLLVYWFLAVYDVLCREASDLLHTQSSGPEDEEKDDTAPAATRTSTVERRTMHFIVGILNERLRHDSSLVPASLSTDVKKALVKILVHSLLDNARGQPAGKEDVEWRQMRMQRLWQLALALDPPTSTVAVVTNFAASADLASTAATVQVPAHNTAEWMLRALLRNAEIQLRFEDAVKEAKAKPQPHAPGTQPNGATSTETAALPDALFGAYLLFTTLDKAASAGFIASTFFHDVLLEQEKALFALAVGGAVQLYSAYGAAIYAFLLRADVLYFFPDLDSSTTKAASLSAEANVSATSLLAVAHSRVTASQKARKPVVMQRCWVSFAAVVRQLIKVEAPGELFLRMLEVLACLTEHPSCCLWLLSTPDLSSVLAPFGWNVKQLFDSVAEVLQGSANVIQQLWQSQESGLAGAYGGRSAPSPHTSVTPGVLGRAGRPCGDLATVTSRLLATHPALPRLVHTLMLGEDTVLHRVSAGLSSIFLSTINPAVRTSFAADAADWVFVHVLLTQPALSGSHFLRLDEPSVNNVARAQGGLWLRALTQCHWTSLSPLFASVAWWLSALVMDLVALSTEDSQSLLEKVVVHLPVLVVNGGSAGPQPSPTDGGADGEGLEIAGTPHMATGASEAATRVQLSRYVHDAEEAALAGSSDEPLPSHVHALCSSMVLYKVVSQLLLTLLKKCSQFGVAIFTNTVLHVASALPARRVAADAKFGAALQKVLLPVCEQLPKGDVDALKQYAPTWMADAVRRAGQTIDECLAEQDRRFAQFEWEEKQVAQAAVDQQRRDAQDDVIARQNMALLHEQAVRERANASTSTASVTSLTALERGIKREREDEAAVPPEDEGWMQAKRHRDALEGQVAALLGQQPTPAASTVSLTTAPTKGILQRPPSCAAAPPPVPIAKKPTVLQQRLQAVNAQHTQHAQHMQNQGELEMLLRRVVSSTNLMMKPPYTGDIIGPGSSCIAREVPVLPSVFVDDAAAGTAASPATGAVARGIQQWAATGRLYANSFAPHIALELRFDIVRSFEEWLDQCRNGGFAQPLQNPNQRMFDPREVAAAAGPDGTTYSSPAVKRLSIAERFPLNLEVDNEASAVMLAPNVTSLVDALNPLEMTFTVQSIDLGTNRYRGGGTGGRGKGFSRRPGRGGAGAAPIYTDFAEGDVVLALLPLATLLPQWIAFQRDRSKADGIVYGLDQQEELLSSIPTVWRVLGCMPHVCYIKALVFGQRTATVATYPAVTIPQSAHQGNTTVGTQRITFQHALHVCFRDGYQVPFYLYKLSSLGQAFTSVNALHRIYETHFASTLYDPRRSATDSQRYLSNVHQLCVVKGALPALRARLLLQSTLNVWQAQAVVAVLYASVPTWDRAPVLDTSVHGYDGASARVLVDSPVTTTSDAAAQLFFGGGSGASAARAESFTTRATVPLFTGSRIPDLLIVEGPPGTGKTQTIAVLVLNLLLHMPPGGRVLLCAPSNCAVDEALLRVQRLQHRLSARHSPYVNAAGSPPAQYSVVTKGKLVRVGVRASVDEAVLRSLPPVFLDDLVDHAVEARGQTAQGNRSNQGGYNATYNNNKNNNSNNSNGNNGDNRNLHNRRLAVKEQTLRDAVVVFSTLGSLNHIQRHGLQFDTVVVDEASQGTEPDVLQALMLAKKKVVLVGDSKQLQPTILCKEAARCGLRRSLLVRLLQNEHRSFLLRTQYRMHPDICAFPNGYFYGAKLRTDPSVLARVNVARSEGAHRGVLGATSATRSVGQKLSNFPRFVFVDVADGAMTGGKGHSLRNQKEAHAVVRHMRQLRTHLRLTVQDFGQRTGIITYYSAQRETIRQLLTNEERQSGLQVATVDSFQGKEKDIILISCVRALNEEQAQRLESLIASNKASSPDGDDGDRVQGGGTASPTAVLAPAFVVVPEEDADDGVDLDGTTATGQAAAATTPSAALPSGTHHRATLGFLSDWHRINVSLTRARELCIVYGHQRTIQLAAAAAPPRRLASSTSSAAAKFDAADGEVDSAHARENLLRELEAMDEDPQLLWEMIMHARRPNVTSTRLAEQERSGRLSIGSLVPRASQSPAKQSSVVDVDADEDELEIVDENGGVSSESASVLTIAGEPAETPHRCRAACLTYELHDTLPEILASYRS